MVRYQQNSPVSFYILPYDFTVYCIFLRRLWRWCGSKDLTKFVGQEASLVSQIFPDFEDFYHHKHDVLALEPLRIIGAGA